MSCGIALLVAPYAAYLKDKEERKGKIEDKRDGVESYFGIKSIVEAEQSKSFLIKKTL